MGLFVCTQVKCHGQKYLTFYGNTGALHFSDLCAYIPVQQKKQLKSSCDIYFTTKVTAFSENIKWKYFCFVLEKWWSWSLGMTAPEKQLSFSVLLKGIAVVKQQKSVITVVFIKMAFTLLLFHWLSILTGLKSMQWQVFIIKIIFLVCSVRRTTVCAPCTLWQQKLYETMHSY